MRITPLDIYQKEFRRVIRGIDADEVEEFLETVADDFEKLIKENKDLREQIESFKAHPNMAGQVEQADRSNGAAREEAVKLIREAKREADNIIREARKEADSIMSRAEDEAHRMPPEVPRESDEVDQQEAVQIVEKAKAMAAELMDKAKSEEMELRRDISRLRGQKERFLIEYRDLLEKHLQVLTAGPDK